MLGQIITISIQKGGSSKSTTNASTAHILANELGFKVLGVDFDPQGNFTEVITGYDTEEFEDETILEAVDVLDGRSYIHKVTENLHIIPADDNLAIFSRRICSRYYEKDKNGSVLLDEDGDIVISPEAGLVLKKTLETVRSLYDFILIDTPPFLSDNIINPLIASDGVVIMYQTSPFAFTAVRRFLETVKDCKEGPNPHLKVYGILPAMIDSRRSDAKAYLELAREKYGNMVFDSIIKNQAAIGRLPIYGFDMEANKELNSALDQYRDFVQELLLRIKEGKHFEINRGMIGRE